MKEPDRARHLKKVATLKLWEADLKEATTTHQPGPSGVQSRNTGGNSRHRLFDSAEHSGLSIEMKEFADHVAIRLSVLEGIWEKAE